MAKQRWKRNIWTGDSFMRVNDNTRIVRIGNRGPYYKEFWGDYSLRYPISSPTFKTIKLALAWKPSCEGTTY